MNKRIFSLVCVFFYVFMAVSIYCSEQKDDRSKASVLRSRIVRAIKKISGSNKNSDIESERGTQSNNNNNKDDFDWDANFKYLNSEQYKKMKYRYTYCCGLFHGYKYPDHSFNSYGLPDY
ncbi:fam-c protein [Plasmodium vinckei lentum]|uniref:Fam-c protein n=1 Tax=Plasmodium vinckei lentum TaxID=138297 RepID=A0A6V7RXY4_PLAVN|nr:fam-c protein [Plasmodium vinckei lentum]